MLSCLWQKLIAKRYSDVTKAEAEVLSQAYIDAPQPFQPPSTERAVSFKPRKRQRTLSGDSSSLANYVVARHSSQDRASDRLSDRQSDRQQPASVNGLDAPNGPSTPNSHLLNGGPSVASLLQHDATSDTPTSNRSQTSHPAASISNGISGPPNKVEFPEYGISIYQSDMVPDPAWKGDALAATEWLDEKVSDDARYLFILLAFLSSNVPLSLLARGASPRKRWGAQGELAESTAGEVGLAPEFIEMFSDASRLDRVLDELVQSHLASRDVEQSLCSVSEEAAVHLRKGLSSEQMDFWRFQALVVSYRSIPWQYLEQVTVEMKSYMKHVQHTVEAAKDLLPTCRDTLLGDLALSLIEASRFPTMRWKRFAVGWATSLVASMETNEDDEYLRCRLSEAESLLQRLTGNQTQSARALDSLSNITGNASSLLSLCHKRLHAALGLAAVQRSLNAIQAGELPAAHKSLDSWKPIGASSCPLEEVVVVRKYMILGRMHRIAGRFRDAKTCLVHSQAIIDRRTHGLVYGEEMRDLVCDLADTLRELDDAAEAEHRLRSEIAAARPEMLVFPGRALLLLSLAEALFAQQHYCQADQLCMDIKMSHASGGSVSSFGSVGSSSAGSIGSSTAAYNTTSFNHRHPSSSHVLLKAEKLRLYVTMAKLRHIQHDDAGALPYWIEALNAAGKFSLDTGGTMRVIIASLTDVLDRKNRPKALADKGNTNSSVVKVPRQSGTPQCYIAGLGRWSDYLQSKNKTRPGHS